MKPNDYIKKTADQVSNEALRARLQEDLTEHIEDREDDGATGTAAAVLGDPALIARQVNAPAMRAVIGGDIVIAGITAFITFIFSSIVTSFGEWDIASNVTEASPVMIIAGSVVGLALWSCWAFVLYLALNRRFISHHGVSSTWAILITIAFFVPWIVNTITDTIMPFVDPANPWATWGALGSAMVARCAVLITFLGAAYLTVRKMTWVNRMLAPSKKLVPFMIAGFLLLGVTAGLVITDTGFEGTIFLPFIIPTLVLYLVWAFFVMSIGALAFEVGFPLIAGWWLVTAALIALGVVYPLYGWVRRKRVAWYLQLLSGITIPMFIVLPFLSRDVPRVAWNIREVWSWYDIEKQQLNVTYPWNATLMRQDDGMNLSYAATVEEGVLTVAQDRSTAIRFVNGRQETARQLERVDETDVSSYGEIPEGFACDGVDLREVSDTHNGSTSPLGMFGRTCNVLTYHEQIIGMITHGGLIDLDLADDGLLAVSINMGSYDPTYVYVVDISQYMK